MREKLVRKVPEGEYLDKNVLTRGLTECGLEYLD